MDRPPKQPSEGFHSVPLQRIADVALRIERELVALEKEDLNSFYKAQRTTEAVIELARAIRALSEYYS
jgi:hypothetical protein